MLRLTGKRFVSFTRFMANIERPVESSIIKKLSESFKPAHISVVNESFKHNVPKGSETHFKVVVVSEKFIGKSPIERHREVNSTLVEELKGPVHALSIQAKTPEQWERSGKKVANTPPCLGGSAA